MLLKEMNLFTASVTVELDFKNRMFEEATSVGEVAEKRGPSHTAGGKGNWCSHHGRRYREVPQKIKNRNTL